jgi:hypothetical protein
VISARFVSPATRFDAEESKTTNRPSALIEPPLLWLLASTPAVDTATLVTCADAGDAASRQAAAITGTLIDGLRAARSRPHRYLLAHPLSQRKIKQQRLSSERQQNGPAFGLRESADLVYKNRTPF